MLGNASLAATTMLASKRCLNHASNTKVGLIVLPLSEEFINNSLLLSNAVHLGNKTRVISHAGNVEIRSKTEEDGKKEVEKSVAVALGRAKCCREKDCRQPVHTSPEKSGREDSS
jgi:hypothetical protein